MIKKILSKNWDFTVYQRDDEKIISVVIFGTVDYRRSFLLQENEADFDIDQLADLSAKIRKNPDEYTDQEIVPAITREK